MLDTARLPEDLRHRSCKPILAIGHSHTISLKRAVDADKIANVDSIDVRRYTFVGSKGNSSVNKDIMNFFDPKIVFCFFGGTENNILGLIESPVPFDFMTPVDQNIDEARYVIPYSQLLCGLERYMEKTCRSNYAAIRYLYKGPIFAFGAPPPFREMDESAVLPQVFQAHRERGIVPRAIRKKLHYAHSELTRRYCAEFGITYLNFPTEIMDGEGFLLREFWSKEPTHGNVLYGRHILRRMQETLECCA